MTKVQILKRVMKEVSEKKQVVEDRTPPYSKHYIQIHNHVIVEVNQIIQQWVDKEQVEMLNRKIKSNKTEKI